MDNIGKFSKKATLKTGEKITYQFVSRDAVILHPSLGCPALVQIDQDKNAWMEIMMVARNETITPTQVAFHLRYKYWNDKHKNVNDYRQLRIWDYFKSVQEIENKENLVKIVGPGDIDTFLNSPESLDENNTFQLKFAHTNIYPWVLEKYKDAGYKYLYKIAVNLGFEDLGSINKKLFNFIWVERDLYKKSKQRPYLMQEYSQYVKERFIPDYNTNLSDFGHVEDKEDFFATKYHPVYISDKQYLDIGHITDLHLDTRMDVYNKSVASVVEVTGNEMEIDKDKKERKVENKNLCRPLKNLVANYNKQFKDISNKLLKKSDLLVLTGDLIDYNKGIHTEQTHENIPKKPSEAWDDLKSKWHRFDSEDHKQDRNWFLFYQSLLDLYDYHNKPIFTLLGNHDYVKHATAPWPFIAAKLIWQGVYDMNLTRYEAALCYGPGYKQLKQAAVNAIKVDKEYIQWYSHYISPFPDIVVNYGDQSLFLVDWAQDHRMIRPKLKGKGGLHNAENIFDDQISKNDPFQLRNHQIYQSWKSSDAKIKILCMHPTLICPRDDISNGETIFDYNCRDSELQYGSFHKRRDEIIQDVENGDLNIVLTGHSHRNMIFELKAEDNGQQLPITSKETFNTDHMKPQNLVAVTSSAGPLPSYLPGGPFICKCKDKYETGFFYVPSKGRLDYDDLYLYKEVHPTTRYDHAADSSTRGHYQQSYIGTYYAAKCPNCNMHGSEMLRKPAKQHAPGANLLLFDREGNVKFQTETFHGMQQKIPRKAVFCEQNDILTGDLKLEDIGSKEEFYYWKPEIPIDIVSRDSFTCYGHMEFPSTVQYISFQEGLLYSEKLGSDRYNVKTEACGDGYTIVRQQIGKDNFRDLKDSATNKNSFAFTRYHFTGNEVWDREIIMTKSLSGRLKDVGGAIASSFSGPLSDPDPFEGLLIRFKTEPDFKKRRKVCGY